MKSYCACWEKEGEKIVRKKTLFPVTRGSEEPSIVLDCSQKTYGHYLQLFEAYMVFEIVCIGRSGRYPLFRRCSFVGWEKIMWQRDSIDLLHQYSEQSVVMKKKNYNEEIHRWVLVELRLSQEQLDFSMIGNGSESV